MRAALIVFIVALSLAPCFGEQADHQPITVSGCMMSMNGTFRLMTPGQTYVLKGHQSSLFSYNGKLIEVTGTVDANAKPAPGIPIVLHITKIHKLADTCH